MHAHCVEQQRIITHIQWKSWEARAGACIVHENSENLFKNQNRKRRRNDHTAVLLPHRSGLCNLVWHIKFVACFWLYLLSISFHMTCRYLWYYLPLLEWSETQNPKLPFHFPCFYFQFCALFAHLLHVLQKFVFHIYENWIHLHVNCNITIYISCFTSRKTLCSKTFNYLHIYTFISNLDWIW